MALDQATRKSGIAIINSDNKQLIYSTVLEEKDKDYVKRIFNMKEKAFKLFDQFNCEAIVFEGTTYQSNPQSLIMLSQLQGMILDEVVKRDLIYLVPKASEWRSNIGIKGRKRIEQKENAKLFIKNKYNIDKTDDECESICIAIYACNYFNKLKEK